MDKESLLYLEFWFFCSFEDSNKGRPRVIYREYELRRYAGHRVRLIAEVAVSGAESASNW
jgi:hypothetical protein